MPQDSVAAHEAVEPVSSPLSRAEDEVTEEVTALAAGAEGQAAQVAVGSDHRERCAHADVEDVLGFCIPNPKYRVSPITDGYYQGRLEIGDAGRLGSTRPTAVGRARRGTRHRPDTVIDGFVIGDLRVAAASLRGMNHHVHGINRQDAYSIGVTSDDTHLIIALADGVSEGQLSEEAADIACETGVRVVRAQIEAAPSTAIDWLAVSDEMRRGIRERAVAMASRTAIDAATGHRVDPATLTDSALAKVMSTTAEILVLGTQRRAEGIPYTRASIAGDGSVFVLDPLRGLRPVSIGKAPGDDGLTSHAVRPLPCDVGAPQVSSGFLSPGQAIMVMTDGYGSQVGDGMNAFGSHLFQSMQRPLDIVAYLQSVSYIHMGANDDRTIATVWAVAAPPAYTTSPGWAR